MERYPALNLYNRAEAAQHDRHRFTSPRGRSRDLLEWVLLRRALASLRRAADGPLHSVIDAPVGTGRLAVGLTRKGFTVTGLDVSEAMIDVARRREATSCYVIARVEQMPFEDGAFDLAVSIRLFGHLPHDAKVAALREMGRVSRRGVIVFFPIETRLVAARGAWRARHGRSLVGHRYPATKAQMAEMGKDGGLRMHRVLSLHSPFAKTRAAVFLAARRRA